MNQRSLNVTLCTSSITGAVHTEKVRVYLPNFLGGSIKELLYYASCCKDVIDKYGLTVNIWHNAFWETLHKDKRELLCSTYKECLVPLKHIWIEEFEQIYMDGFICPKCINIINIKGNCCLWDDSLGTGLDTKIVCVHLYWS